MPIIGVLPKGFVAPSWGMPSAAWDGLVFYAKPPSFAPIARLSQGATPTQAAAEIEALVAASTADGPICAVINGLAVSRSSDRGIAGLYVPRRTVARPSGVTASPDGGASGCEWNRGQRKLAGGQVLLALEAALGVILVLAAAGAVRSLAKLVEEGVGLDPRGLYRVGLISAPGATSGPRLTPGERLDNYKGLLMQSQTLPGVAGVAGADSVVGSGEAPMRSFSTDREIPGGRYEVSAGYFWVAGSPRG